MPMRTEFQVQCQLQPVNEQLQKLTIAIPTAVVESLYSHILNDQKGLVHAYGFSRGQVPISYIELYYHPSIIDHLKELLLKFFVIHYLYDYIHEKKLIIAGQPRLHDIVLQPHKDALYIFELSLIEPIELLKWKNLPFKSPRRKNYKDIDRQVATWIEEEQNLKNKSNGQAVEIGDWISFDIAFVDDNDHALFDNYKENLWLRIGEEEADIPFQEVFLNRSCGQSFISSAACLQEFFSNHIKTNFKFVIDIKGISKNSYVCLDYFKHHFRLKSLKDIQKKVIEIFSYRNDLSLRRSIVEEALKLLISKHHLQVPNAMVLRQQKIVLESVSDSSDYRVYKTHPQFKDHVRKLAEKQAKEMVIIDHIAIEEGIDVVCDDMIGYLNLLKKPRPRELVYFRPPASQYEAQEMPVNEAVLKYCCKREKTLNHVIYHLTKK